MTNRLRFKAATYNIYYKTSTQEALNHVSLLKREGVTIILAQEINDKKVAAFRKAGWKVVKNPHASNAVMWLESHWEALAIRQEKLAPDYMLNKNVKIKTHSPFVRLRHKSGRTMWALSYHLPSGVQRKKPFANRRRISDAAAKSLDRLGRTTGTALFGGDDNVDERNGFWRWLERMKSLKQVQAPRGTHGNRRIDDFRIKGLIPLNAYTLTSPSDHRTHVRNFEFAPPKKARVKKKKVVRK